MKAAYTDCKGLAAANAVAAHAIAASAFVVVEPWPDDRYRVYVKDDQRKALPKRHKLTELKVDPFDPATDAEIERARDEYGLGSSDNIEIDEGAGTSRADNGVWVQAWVWLANEEPEAAS